MARSVVFFLLLCFFLLIVGNQVVEAAWIENGIPACTASGNQCIPVVVADLSGNTITAWMDYRNGSGYVYVQKIDTLGNVLWDLDGKPIGYSRHPEQTVTPGGRLSIIENELNETVIAWDGEVNGVPGVYAQKLSASGDFLWGAQGIFVGPGTAINSNRTMVSDGAGGAIVVWADARAGESDIFAQRVDQNGNILWNPEGVLVCGAPGDQLFPYMTSDLHGGAIVVWMDLRDGDYQYDLYAQRISLSGVMLWGQNGVPISTVEGNKMIYYDHTIVSDGKGGAIIGWRDLRRVSDIYAQRVDAKGNVKWAVDGIPICTAAGTQSMSELAADGVGGAYVAWYDYRSFDYDIYAQHVDSAGTIAWDIDGIAVCAVSGWQIYPCVATNGPKSAVFSWQDARDGDYDIYAQKLDSRGNRLWQEGGIPICKTHGDQCNMNMVLVGASDIVAVWDDQRSSNKDIYAQKILGNGLPPYLKTQPTIIAIKDVPADEGGWVRMSIKASYCDRVEESQYPITGYNVWREISQPFLGAGVSSGSVDLSSALTDVLESAAKPEKSIHLRLTCNMAAALGFPPGEWESVGFHAARQQETYDFIIGTLKDSTEADTGWETFVVTAHTPVPAHYFVSGIDSGYSVDNLAPQTPQGFTGTTSDSEQGLRLAWNASGEKDLAHYALYRGTSRDFIPEPGSRILMTSATTALDPEWTRDTGYCYKLSAVDRHGNESAPAILEPQGIEATYLLSFSALVRELSVEVTWTVSRFSVGSFFSIFRCELPDQEYVELPSSRITRDDLTFGFTDANCEPGKSYRYRVEVTGETGTSVLFETNAIQTPVLPVTLCQNYPNPFNPSTSIKYYLPDRGMVRLDIFNAGGARVATLVDKEEAQGYHVATWNGNDANGRCAVSGVYFCRLSAGNEMISKKMLLLR